MRTTFTTIYSPILNEFENSGSGESNVRPIADASSLDEHLGELMATDRTDNLVFSFFLDLSASEELQAQVSRLGRRLEAGLDATARADLFEAEEAILDVVGKGLDGAYQGMACHYRSGDQGFFKVIAFHVPLKPVALADAQPHIVPLIELRDSYDRYVVLISTEEQARIIEVVLGSVTREAWLKRPELRKRVGREWTRDHYQNHRRDRDRQFVREKLNVLEELMSKSGHSHLILAGNDKRVALIEKELPEGLRKRVVDVCRLGVNDPREKVVAETIEAFIEQEAYESQVNLARLQEAILQGTGAVVGLNDCEAAMEAGVVDTLILVSSDNESQSTMRVYQHRHPKGIYTTTNKRFEELVRNAVAKEIPLEFVPRGSFLDDYAGVGAILRYRGAEYVAANQ